MIAAITESELEAQSEKISDRFLVMTGTVLRGGQGIWRFCWM